MASIDTNPEIDQRIEWLRARYQKYLNPPMWAFDARVRFRFVGSLGTMAFSRFLSEIVPVIMENVGP